MRLKKRLDITNVTLLFTAIVLFSAIVLVLFFTRNLTPIRNPIQGIILNRSDREVSFEATVIPVGGYIYLENDAWAIRAFFDDFAFSFGDRINVEGVSSTSGTKLRLIDVSSAKLISKNFPINPIEIKSINKRYVNRVVEIKNQKLLHIDTETLKGSLFWVLDYGDYTTVIPTDYVDVSIKENETYDIIGIVGPAAVYVWSFSIT